MSNDYQRTLKVDVSAEKAFEGISRVSEWWVKKTEGTTKQAGDTFTVRFSGEVFVTFLVTDSVPNRKATWKVTECYLPWLKDKTEWTGTQVHWNLTEKDNATEINFVHEGLVPEVECYNGCVKGWDQYMMQSLPKLLLENQGQPN
jgi:hypothetical protein